MQVRDLIERLEEIVENADSPDIEVRLMVQESYPFEHLLEKVVTLEEMNADKRSFKPAGKHGYSDKNAPKAVIYLVEGNQLGYGTKRAWEEM